MIKLEHGSTNLHTFVQQFIRWRCSLEPTATRGPQGNLQRNIQRSLTGHGNRGTARRDKSVAGISTDDPQRRTPDV